MTMGIVEVASLAARVTIGPAVTMMSTLRPTSSAASPGSAIEFTLCISPLNDNVFPLHVTKLAQPLPECLDTGRDRGSGSTSKISYPRDFRRLLRLGADRKVASRQQRSSQTTILNSQLILFLVSNDQIRFDCRSSLDRLESDYLITLSARASTFGGIVRPICLAAFRLMINSNFVGCSTGRSAGLAPFRILSTYVAARRYKSVMFTP